MAVYTVYDAISKVYSRNTEEAGKIVILFKCLVLLAACWLPLHPRLLTLGLDF